MAQILKSGAQGQAVADLQALLIGQGYALERTHVYDGATFAAVLDVQRAARLVADGVYGPKTAAALAGADLRKLMKESDLQRAADMLGVSVVIVKAVNEVEVNSSGFLADGRPVILFERHVFYRQLGEYGLDPEPLALRLPGIVNQQRGGYAGGAAEYRRLATAVEVCGPAAWESASWGAFQVMGYHWKRLGYPTVEDFVARMQRSEGEHLDAFVRFVKADPALHKALAARKWAVFAKGYNGPAYRENLYDIKLERAYDRHAKTETVAV